MRLPIREELKLRPYDSQQLIEGSKQQAKRKQSAVEVDQLPGAWKLRHEGSYLSFARTGRVPCKARHKAQMLISFQSTMRMQQTQRMLSISTRAQAQYCRVAAVLGNL